MIGTRVTASQGVADFFTSSWQSLLDLPVQSEEKHNVHIEKVLDAAEEGSCWGWIVVGNGRMCYDVSDRFGFSGDVAIMWSREML